MNAPPGLEDVFRNGAHKLDSILFGGIIAASLFGCSTVQTITFFRHREADAWLLKATMCVLWCLSSLQLVLLAHWLNFYLIANYANPYALLKPVWSLAANVIVTETSCCLVSLAYAWRVYVLSGRKWVIPTVLAVCRLPCTFFSFFFAIRSIQMETFEHIFENTQLEKILYAGFSIGTVYDILITAAMCYYLRKAHRKAGSNRMDSAISRIMMYAFNSAAIVSMQQLATLVTYAIMRDNFVYIAIYTTIPGMYINALLASLNARERLRLHQRGPLSCSFPIFRGEIEESTASRLPHQTMEAETHMRVTVCYPQSELMAFDERVEEVCRDSKSITRTSMHLSDSILSSV
ncbi:hypothetical protein SCHPADRAFT_353623 [Schizopora paradoxa]|uniref:DUF6534 domain-containing protein n=1 Tax=Schizopora paradoxa TaxID=27342 RepID=A0A0H2S9W9_9AGAM|nr:hypothetical protein SCHPADRAFT_353623 [Schizopora paradoxa]